jgi:hypothetical protein
MATPRLKEIRLPAGDVVGLNIGWFRDGSQIKLDPQTWLAEGFDGVRIIGAGIDRTMIRADMYDGNAVAIGRHPGITQLEALTVVAGYSMGIQCGEQNLEHELVPKFQLRLIGVKGVCPPPIPGFQRTKWWCLAYQADGIIEDVEVDGALLSEHDFYFHGFAQYGLFVRRLKCVASGAQNLKVRSAANETAWPGAKAKIHVEESVFQRAGQEWSDRGDGLIVIEGGASIIEIQDCIFRASRPNAPHAHAIMISSESGSYDWATGRVGSGFGNGPVAIKRIAANGWLANPWNNGLVRCGRNGGTQQVTPSFLLEDSGVFGRNMLVQLGGIPKGKSVIRGCNTLAIREQCARLGGFDTETEASYPGPQRLIPLSEGIVV